jgi:hypothetical protein
MSKKIQISLNVVAADEKAIACDLNNQEDGDLEQILKEQENDGRPNQKDNEDL